MSDPLKLEDNSVTVQKPSMADMQPKSCHLLVFALPCLGLADAGDGTCSLFVASGTSAGHKSLHPEAWLPKDLAKMSPVQQQLDM